MKLATVTVTPEQLSLMMGLPPSTIVHRIIWDQQHHLVRLIVEHPLLPEHDGGDGPLPPAAEVIWQRTDAYYFTEGGAKKHPHPPL